MTDGQKKVLLCVVRDSVKSVLTGKSSPSPKSDDPELNEHCGCFVTLKNRGRLRGCLGNFVSEVALIELVSEMASATATSDPRFVGNPVTSGELEHLDFEISVLSPLKRTDDPLSLRLGVDGIYIKQGFSSGCFLPQVADEAGWSKEEFLSYCCAHKAGLAYDAWKEAETEVYFFTAEVFGADFKEI